MTQANATFNVDDLFDTPAAPEMPPILDRSTLEAWATCPAQGMAVEKKLVMTGSPEADAGSEVHRAITEVVKAIVDGRISNAAEARDYMLDIARRSRPDVQPEVVRSLMPSAWGIAQHLLFHENSSEPRHSSDIIMHDGGEGDRRGQIARDFELGTGKLRLTCEVDLLLATASSAELELIDFKSGHTVWASDDIHSSFQLGCFYPAMVLLNFSSAESVRVRVWNTRINRLAGAVVFHRRTFLADALQRISSALEVRQRWLAKPFHKLEVWPTPTKCCICPAARICPGACLDGPLLEVADDPVAALERLISLEAAAADLKDKLAVYADENGDITLDDDEGTTFGRNKPVSTKKPPAGIYVLGQAKL